VWFIVVFNRRLHEPGPQTVFGKTYPDDGVEQGRAVLTDLARHPATAEHIALKVARHFVADQPATVVRPADEIIARQRRRPQGIGQESCASAIEAHVRL
jgi:uncharacterized protein (DUF1800 family)